MGSASHSSPSSTNSSDKTRDGLREIFQRHSHSTYSVLATIKDTMKASPISTSILVTAILLLGSARPAAASEPGYDIDYTPGAVAADALIVRPLCLVATAAGTGLFIVTLPIAAVSKSVDKSAKALVGTPGHHTFVRSLGD